MSASLMLHPCGNLSAVHPQAIYSRPIAAVAVAVGDLVKFDIGATNSTYSDLAKIEDYDDPKCPFNVVVAATASTATSQKGGIWAVVTEAAAAGERCTVCIHGVVDAKVTTTTTTRPMTAGDTVLEPGAGVLVPALATPANTGGAAIAVTLVTQATTSTALRKVLFNGYGFSIGGA